MPRERRGFKEGSCKQRPNGKWQARVTTDGRRLSHDFATKTEGLAWIRKQQSEADQGMLLPDKAKITVETFLTVRWLPTIEPELKPKSHEGYDRVMRRDVLPTLGKLLLTQLRQDQIQALYAAKLKAGLSATTVRLVHAVLHRSMEDAVKWRLLRRNPCEGVSIPRARKKEMKVWAPAEAQRFLASVTDPKLMALYRVALGCGLRQGEIRGLRWDDLDLQAGTLQVKRTLVWCKGLGITAGEPKTAKGRRLVVMPAATTEALRSWRLEQLRRRHFMGKQWKQTGYVFSNLVGGPMQAEKLRQDFEKAIEAAGLPVIRFHDLRHTAATLLLSKGVHAKVVSEMLGHANIAITLDTYSHVLPSMQAEAARVMEGLLP
ncbi:MAG: tyrosine-type recombinase/integrase [Dehalococcoidia bacterium]|nr:tyrosine-type recombinase/integrase [Dehalococcoidia bacterium]